MPADIEHALSTLSLVLASYDEGALGLNITLYDGDGVNCPGNEYLGPGSLRTGCFRRSVYIPVTLLPYSPPSIAESAGAGSATTLSFREYVIGSAIVAVVILACARCWYVRSRRRRLARYGTTAVRSCLSHKTVILNAMMMRTRECSCLSLIQWNTDISYSCQFLILFYVAIYTTRVVI